MNKERAPINFANTDPCREQGKCPNQFGNMQLCINAQYIQSRAAHQEYDINLKLQLMYL